MHLIALMLESFEIDLETVDVFVRDSLLIAMKEIQGLVDCKFFEAIAYQILSNDH